MTVCAAIDMIILYSISEIGWTQTLGWFRKLEFWRSFNDFKSFRFIGGLKVLKVESLYSSQMPFKSPYSHFDLLPQAILPLIIKGWLDWVCSKHKEVILWSSISLLRDSCKSINHRSLVVLLTWKTFVVWRIIFEDRRY